MEKRIRRFLWTISVALKKLVSVSWDRCCSPKREGGLVLKNLYLLNEALLSKLEASIH